MKYLSLTQRDIIQLRSITFSNGYPQRIVKRALIVLRLAEGRTINDIIHELKTTRKTIVRSCQRFYDHGLEGVLEDAPRSGRRNGIGWPSGDELIDIILRKNPPNGLQWSIRTLAQECQVSPSTMYRLVRRYRLPLSRDDLKMQFYLDQNQIIDIAGIFISSTLKAVTFTERVDFYEEGPVSIFGSNEDSDSGKIELASLVESTSKTSIHLMMARTDQLGSVTHLQILVPMKNTHLNCSDVTPETITFYHYKVHELHLALKDTMLKMNASGKLYDIDMLVFLKCIERKVIPGMDILMVMNSPSQDVNGRISTWLAKHPRFRVSFNQDDHLWLDMIIEYLNEISDEDKRRVTFKLEYLLAMLAERTGMGTRPIICYFQR